MGRRLVRKIFKGGNEAKTFRMSISGRVIGLIATQPAGAAVPAAETFYLLYENGDRILTEDGSNLLRTE